MWASSWSTTICGVDDDGIDDDDGDDDDGDDDAADDDGIDGDGVDDDRGVGNAEGDIPELPMPSSISCTGS